MCAYTLAVRVHDCVFWGAVLGVHVPQFLGVQENPAAEAQEPQLKNSGAACLIPSGRSSLPLGWGQGMWVTA